MPPSNALRKRSSHTIQVLTKITRSWVCIRAIMRVVRAIKFNFNKTYITKTLVQLRNMMKAAFWRTQASLIIIKLITMKIKRLVSLVQRSPSSNSLCNQITKTMSINYSNTSWMKAPYQAQAKIQNLAQIKLSSKIIFSLK